MHDLMKRVNIEVDNTKGQQLSLKKEGAGWLLSLVSCYVSCGSWMRWLRNAERVFFFCALTLYP